MSTHIQTLIFDRDHFTVWQAAAWAKKHGFKAKIDSSGGALRARQHDPSPHKHYRTIPLRPGVQAVVQVTTTRRNPDVAGAILEALKANADPRFLSFLLTFEGMIREAITEVVAETESAPAVAPEEAPAAAPKKRGRPKKSAAEEPLPVLQVPPKDVSTADVAGPYDHDGKLTFIWSAHDPNESQWATQPRFPQADLFKVNLLTLKYTKLLANYTVRGILDLHAKEVRHALDLQPVHVEDGWFGPNDAMILAEYADISTQARFWRVGRYDAKAQTFWIDSTLFSATASKDLIRRLLIANWPVRELRQQIEELKDFPDPNHRKVMEAQGWDFLMKLGDPLQHAIDPVAMNNTIQALWHMDRMGAQIRQIVEQDRHDTQAHIKVNALIDSINSAARKLGDESAYSIESTQIGEDWIKTGAGRAAEGETEETESIEAFTIAVRLASELEEEVRTAYAAIKSAITWAQERGALLAKAAHDLTMDVMRVTEGSRDLLQALADLDEQAQQLQQQGIDIEQDPSGYGWRTLEHVVASGQKPDWQTDMSDLPPLDAASKDWVIVTGEMLAHAVKGTTAEVILREWLPDSPTGKLDFRDESPIDLRIPFALFGNGPAFLRVGNEMYTLSKKETSNAATQLRGKATATEEEQARVSRALMALPKQKLGDVRAVVKKSPDSYIKGFKPPVSEYTLEAWTREAEEISDNLPSPPDFLLRTLFVSPRTKKDYETRRQELTALEEQIEGYPESQIDTIASILSRTHDRLDRIEKQIQFVEEWNSTSRDWDASEWAKVWAPFEFIESDDDSYVIEAVELENGEVVNVGGFIDDNDFWIRLDTENEPGERKLSRVSATGAVRLFDIMRRASLPEWLGLTKKDEE